MGNHSRYNRARKAQIFWCLFIGIGAIAGATGMLLKPDGSALGMQTMLPYFQVLPFSKQLFQNYIFPGISLLIVNGITNLVAAVLLFRRKKIGTVLSGVFGLTLMAWICIQFVIFPLNFMSTIYFIFGIAQAATGYASYVFYMQEHFTFSESDYPNIGTNKKELVVYFSRMGYTRKLAYEAANASGADIYEVKSTERVLGTLGFWWCGRYGMHSWEMPIEPLSLNLESYTNVTVCSPVWVFSLAAPIKSFCTLAAGKLQNPGYILVHHTGNKYINIANSMDSVLKTKHSSFQSVRCHKGSFKKL